MPITKKVKKVSKPEPKIVVTKKIPLNPVHKGGKTTRLYMLPYNRAISSHHVMDISKSIKIHGWLGTIKCIETTLYSKTPRVYVVDGQHSFTAALSINADYRYEVKKVKTQHEIITLMADLNNNSKGWFLHDYLKVWNFHGLTAYKYLHDITTRTHLPLAPLIAIYSKHVFGSHGGATTQKFKEGRLELKNKKMADKIVTELEHIKPVLGNVKDTFILAFADLYATMNYNRDRFLNVLSNKKNKHLINQLTSTIDIRDLLKQLYK